ncbi:hypothetical protein llap_9517 [Limosa lapponica baueri]|uniref:Uncharacterized protein n=1 Tax=Limosa lapponica baueri TaxID=1758121 RepID=A0A2I0U2C4_LIMLA|nr:hypothetical protein llap_9517 [Limosa lapponica baueri]
MRELLPAAPCPEGNRESPCLGSPSSADAGAAACKICPDAQYPEQVEQGGIQTMDWLESDYLEINILTFKEKDMFNGTLE